MRSGFRSTPMFSFDQNRRDGDFDDSGRTLPAEMIGDKVVSEGIEFALDP